MRAERTRGIDVGAVLLPRQQAGGRVAGAEDQVDLLLPQRPGVADQGLVAGDEVVVGQEAELERAVVVFDVRPTVDEEGAYGLARSAAWPQTTIDRNASPDSLAYLRAYWLDAL